jgi:hypothetical protein
MHEVPAQDTLDDLNPIFTANPPDNLLQTQTRVTHQSLQAILCHPDKMAPMIENTVFASVKMHDHSFQRRHRGPSGRRKISPKA